MKQQISEAEIQRNRLKLLLIAGVPLIVVLTATVLWHGVATGKLQMNLGTKNRGTFVLPMKEIDQLALQNFSGEPYVFAGQEKPWWTFVVFGGANCEEACQQTIFQNRGIKRTLGKKSDYVRVAYISSAEQLSPSTKTLFETEYDRVMVLKTSESSARSLFSDIRKPVDPFAEGVSFLVDPYGLAMMYYTPEQDYKDITKDLKILLKMSSH